MPERNILVLLLSVLGGGLLIVSGTSTPIGLYEEILQKLPLFIKDPRVLSIVTTMALALVTLSRLGGLAVIVGGYVIYRGHVMTGKLMIGVGAGVGIPYLLFIAYTVIVTQELTSVTTRHSITGWMGIIISFVARMIAKRPSR